MKKLWSIIAVLVAIMLIVILALALLRSPGRRIVDWGSIVTSYIEHKDWSAQATINQAVKARMPSNFTQEMNLLTYGEAPYYMVNETSSSYNGSRPIPYPPKEVWCVLLQQRTAEGDFFNLIFANLHEDMYMAEWIVHEGEKAPFSQAFLEHVASFGCDLDFANIPEE